MAYPFAPMPKLSVFVERLCSDYDCEVQDLGLARGSRSVEPASASAVVREVDGTVLFAPLQSLPEGSHLTPSLLRWFCRRLQLPPEDFGLTLG